MSDDVRQALIRLSVLVGLAVVVTYFSVRGARGPREKRFVARGAPWLGAWLVAATMAGYYLAWYFHVAIFGTGLFVSVWLFNKKQVAIRREEQAESQRSR